MLISPIYTCHLHRSYGIVHRTELRKLLSVAALRISEISTGYPDCMVGQVRVGVLHWKKVLSIIALLWLFSLRKLGSEYFWASEKLPTEISYIINESIGYKPHFQK